VNNYASTEQSDGDVARIVTRYAMLEVPQIAALAGFLIYMFALDHGLSDQEWLYALIGFGAFFLAASIFLAVKFLVLPLQKVIQDADR